MKYTHKIKWFSKELLCFVYKNIPEQEGKAYIRTEDFRSCWWPKNEIIKVQ